VLRQSRCGRVDEREKLGIPAPLQGAVRHVAIPGDLDGFGLEGGEGFVETPLRFRRLPAVGQVHELPDHVRRHATLKGLGQHVHRRDSARRHRHDVAC
jgi:hypothetical protein